MANLATSTYKVIGSRKVVSDLWTAFQSMNVNTKNIWLDELAKYYGIDYETKHISVRGHIYCTELTVNRNIILKYLNEHYSPIAGSTCNESILQYRFTNSDRSIVISTMKISDTCFNIDYSFISK